MSSTDIIIQSGVTAYSKREYKEAEKYFLQAQRRKDHDPITVRYYLGLINVRYAKWDKAIDELKELIKLELPPVMAKQVRQILGYIYVQKGQHKLAAEIYRTVLDSFEPDVQTWSALGYCYYKTGQSDDAIAALKEALLIDQNNANALNSLGFISLESGKDVESALAVITKALEQNPDNPAYKDSMGWALFRKGEKQAAKEYLADAMELLPDNEEIREHFKELVVSDIRKKGYDTTD